MPYERPPASIVEIVARNVKAARLARGIKSRRALAQLAGVSINSVRYIEEPDARAPTTSGSHAPRLDILDRIANALHIATWQLLVDGFDPGKPLEDQPITRAERKFFDQIERTLQLAAGSRKGL